MSSFMIPSFPKLAQVFSLLFFSARPFPVSLKPHLSLSPEPHIYRVRQRGGKRGEVQKRCRKKAEEGRLRRHMYRVMCFWAKAMAYSATTVFPADV